MKDDLDDLGTSVTSKLPPIGRAGCFAILGACGVVVLIIGFGIGFSVGGSGPGGNSLNGRPRPLALNSGGGGGRGDNSPYYIYLANNSKSCPPLQAERLLTTMEDGQSFEGLVVNLACRGDYVAYPNQIKCRRPRGPSTFADDSLEWSHVPLCYPSVLVSKTHWTKVLHARSVACVGDAATGTTCKLTCIRDYIGVESKPYKCDKMPCPAWNLGDAKCFMCDKKCENLHAVSNPRSSALLSKLSCSPTCDNVLVNSDGNAAIWQNKRTGLFKFIGEHNGRPVYQNNATMEFLFYTFTGSEWLVGPDFRQPHAGIQMYGNEDTQCPERNGGKNVSRLYIDSSEPSPGGNGKWTTDDTLDFKCLAPDYDPVDCACRNFKVYHLTYQNGTVPSPVEYLTGNFTRIDEKDYGLMAPLYRDVHKGLYLFSHHPQGRVWQVSTKLSTTPLRGIFSKGGSCPDTEQITWEWFNTTTAQGQQLYVKDDHIVVKCLDGR
jgi:hypothetical protein